MSCDIFFLQQSYEVDIISIFCIIVKKLEVIQPSIQTMWWKNGDNRMVHGKNNFEGEAFANWL